MMTSTADFNVTSFSDPTTAVEWNKHTLSCRYTIPAYSASGGDVHVNWFKSQRDNSTCNESPGRIRIWKAKKFRDNSINTDFNDAWSGYKPQLNGSSISSPDFLSKHSITFKRIRLDDEGDYCCCVYLTTDKGHNSACSPSFHVDVIGRPKYVPVCRSVLN